MPRPVAQIRRLAPLVAALGAALVTGCGGGGGPDARALLKDTFGPGHPIRSGRLDLSLAVAGDGAGLGEPFRVTVGGPFVSAGRDRLPRFAFTIESPATKRAQAVSAGLISTGKAGFITLEGQPFTLSAQAYRRLAAGFRATAQSDRERRRTAPSLSALGIDPGRWLADVENRGVTDVAGSETIRIGGAIDQRALLADVDRLLRRSSRLAGAAAGTGTAPKLDRAVRAALERSVAAARLDVWTGAKDHTLRALRLELRLEVAPDDRATLAGLRRLTVDLDLAIADLGRPQRIVAPPDARPVAELTRALAELARTAAPAAPGPARRYEDCAAQAGTDLARLQACGALLGR